ncbi:hypothetical protein FA15DRAFT_671150 [Coprinopsis marcescibilis]|uniref:Nephrocystin 3-like N-terminal domain-containing protein n=1 Tax=Coprinopsis marcescibilis TaxID=230819 RepID=A0A5C3KQI6_COPMA|nr:hypothetical protein FA15DRAFT_671150 [Coprinopsis marcescibilis]
MTSGRAFDGAHNFSLSNVDVLVVGRDHVMNNNHYHASTDPMSLLRDHCAIDATHDSEIAAYAPRCKPGTRQTVLRDIMSWATSTPSNRLHPYALLWFSGPAGGGKSCIQREVVDCCKAQGRLAASYFFSTRISGLDDCRRFVATIALQLCMSTVGLQRLVEDEIRRDPGIFGKSLEAQFEGLIQRPLEKLRRKWDLSTLWTTLHGWVLGWPAAKVIVVDGMDECRGTPERARLIRLLALAISKFSLPFRIIVTSRPEYDIRSTFDEKGVKEVTHRIRLEDYGCDTDIRGYLIDTIFDIRSRHPSAEAIPPEWPSQKDVETVVSQAAGQFIYASTFLNFIDNPRRDLVETFNLALNFPTHSTVDLFAPLDSLYTAILGSIDVDQAVLKRLLHGVAAMSSAQGQGQIVSTTLLDDFFHLKPGTSATAFCDLHSIISVPPAKSRAASASVRFHHKSLEDYLLSPQRSGRFYRSRLDTHREMFELCCHQVLKWSKLQHIQQGDTLSRTYAASGWVNHAQYLLDNGEGSRLLLDDAEKMPEMVLKYASIELKASNAEFMLWAEKQRILQIGIHEMLCSKEIECAQICVGITRVCEVVTRLNRIFSQNFPKDIGSSVSWDEYSTCLLSVG